MTIPPSYRKPFAYAVGVHLLLLIILIIKLPSWSYQYNSGGKQTQIVHATAVTSAQVQQAMQAIQNRQDASVQQEQQHVAELQHQAEAEKQQQAAAAQRLVHMQQEQLHLQQQRVQQVAALTALKQQAVAAQQQAQAQATKALTAKLHQQKLQAQAAKAQAAKQQQQKLQAQKRQALMAAQQRLQQKILAQQLAGDTSQVQQQIQTTQLNGIVDKYKALIISAIGQQWLVPSGVDPSLSCIYEIQLAPGGVVLSVTLVKSSGNSALDQSAQTAIYKASPLPVPTDPTAFDNFRDLRLTVSPKQINNSP